MHHDIESSCRADNIAEEAIANTITNIAIKEFHKFAESMKLIDASHLDLTAEIVGTAIRKGYAAYHAKDGEKNSGS